MSAIDNSLSLSWDDKPNAAHPDVRRGPIPMVIGVTGHIDLDLRADNNTKLQKATREILGEIRRNAPHSPIVVLSALAEGADRLVTKIALDEFDAHLIAVLPLPIELYEADFPSTVTEFHDLLQKGRRVVLPLIGENTLESVSQPGLPRDAQYMSAGAFIVQHCQALIALWNGLPGGEGGTSEVLQLALDGANAEYSRSSSLLDPLSVPPVYRIVTPRIKTSEISGKPFSWEVLNSDSAPASVRRTRFIRVARRLNRFNRDCVRYADAIREQAAEFSKRLVPPDASPLVSNTVRRIARLYGIADALAVRFRARNRRALVFLLGFGVAGVLCFELYAHHVVDRWWVISAYPIALFIAMLFYAYTRWRDVQNKYLDYRALAEGLRVQCYWRMANLTDHVADHYLTRHRTELDWIRESLKAWNICWDDADCQAADRAPADFRQFQLVRDLWAKDQLTFFSDRKERNERGNKVQELIVWGPFLASILLGVALAFAHKTFEHEHWYHVIHTPVVLLIGILPVLAAAVGGYAERMAFAAQAQRYDWMAELFHSATKELDRQIAAGDPVALQAVIRELGAVALEENANWVLMHRDRPLEIHF